MLTLVVAKASNDVIGRHNGLPWRLPADLAHFKAVTLDKPIIMGRKTFDSIGRPLPGRRNIVVTRNADWAHAGCERAASLTDALQLAGDASEICLIGGAQLYAQAMPLADRLIVTEIQRDFDGDAFFPPIDRQMWRETRRVIHHHEGTPVFRYDFVCYEKITA